MTETMQNIRKLLKGLSREDLEQLNSEITERLEEYVGLPDFFHKCMEQRFSDGLVCPNCSKKHINVAKLADVLGHSSIETTRIYLISTGVEHAKTLNMLQLVF